MARDPLAQPEEAIKRLYAYVAYRIGPGPEAEDIVSETIERALRYRKSYDHRKGSPAAWLAGIASRVIADQARASPQSTGLDRPIDPVLDDFSAASLQRLNLMSAITAIDERSRELLALRYGADLRAREIAELLNLRTNTVEVALTRALQRLRAVMEAGGSAPWPAPQVPAAIEGSERPAST